MLVSWRRYLQGPGQEGPKILALGLSSRKNLCIHPRVAGTHPATSPHSNKFIKPTQACMRQSVSLTLWHPATVSPEPSVPCSWWAEWVKS